MSKKIDIEQVLGATSGVDSAGEEISQLFFTSLTKSLEGIGLGTEALQGALRMAIGQDHKLSPKERANFRDQAAISAGDMSKTAFELFKHATFVASKATGTVIPGIDLLNQFFTLRIKLRDKKPLPIFSEATKIILTTAGIILIPISGGTSVILLGVASAINGGELAITILNKIHEKIYLKEKPADLEIKTLSDLADTGKEAYIRQITDQIANDFKNYLEESLCEQEEKAVILTEAEKYLPQTKIGKETFDVFVEPPVKSKDDFAGVELTDFSTSPLRSCSLLTQRNKSDQQVKVLTSSQESQVQSSLG